MSIKITETGAALGARIEGIDLKRALEVPVQDGRVLGDTVFASTSAAYDALSGTMKKRLEGSQALHSIIHRHEKTLQSGRKKEYSAAVKADPEALHPVVRVHPITKRNAST